MTIIPEGFQRVIFASWLRKCDCCDEPWCEVHDEHFADCQCIGPTEDDVEYMTVNGVLYGKRI